jgi:DNA end-binding protein Ku
MAPRANWKGFLRLSLVTCPVALYPATSESEKISFNQLNRKTGHRIKYAKVDADTGEEVANEDIVKGYKVDTDTFVEVTKEELENVALESTRTIEIDEFVDRTEIDPRYLIRPYYLRPDGKVGHDAFAVIRETIREMNKVAIGRVVLTNREHIIALEPMDKGLMGTLLRYPYEVRDPQEYFDDIQDVKVTKDMLDLARHIVEQKSGSFEPDKFEDQYETALVDLINHPRRCSLPSAPCLGCRITRVACVGDYLLRSCKGERHRDLRRAQERYDDDFSGKTMISVAKRAVILIVEDELLIRMHAVEMIEEAFEVVEAASADEAIAISRSPLGYHGRIHRYSDAGQHGRSQACCGRA